MPSAPDAILIRPVAADDLAAITTIYAHAVHHGTASFELDPPSEDEMRRRHAMLKAASHPYLVATRGDRVVGYAYAGPYRLRAAYRSTVEDSIYLAADAQGHGIGRLLLTALIEASTEAGFRQMVGIIGDSRHEASIRLHAALGFRHVGIFENVGWKHGRWLDCVMMQRTLGAGSDTPPSL